MTENHPTLGVFEGKPIYGIKKIEVRSGNKQAVIKNCKQGDDGNTNKWEIIDNKFSDPSVSFKYGWERNYQLTSANRLLGLVNILLELPKKIEKDLLKV